MIQNKIDVLHESYYSQGYKMSYIRLYRRLYRVINCTNNKLLYCDHKLFIP